MLIADALRMTLSSLDKPSLKAAKRAGLAKIGIGSWLSFGLSQIGTPKGATLTEVLRAVVELAGQPAALVIDEAQHALTTPAGIDAMFALKAARDVSNGASARGNPRLLLIMTGSHRDKLANPVVGRDTPFFGASVTDFPRLGRDFSDAYTIWLNERLAHDNRFAADGVWTAFEAVGGLPERLRDVLQGAALGEGKAASLGVALRDGAMMLRQREWENFSAEWASLSTLQRAVLKRIVAAGTDFQPFSATALAAYAVATGREVSVSEAQNAVDALRERNLIWRSARGTYAFEDQDFETWLRNRASD